ncbi:hypothetical protein ISF_03053 [Cordyceps fumosorosea ARSEF 2679]|uniref:Uncharacterized protein n=1 Tax=Cordyceps fumosorosea (strain ARSEF 2679) TaxID=1081104 RepID=A0A168B8W7_CORFA|nr:hypothetical protein ISF_03053 [Cordyceps fumosorosea ARSEF 2679]OAA69783.1 hypothetical protein ISF_03053 [Cordyceps fumosorosea ARSEF 2679]
MDPRSKFVTPQPAAPSHADLSIRRTGTAPAALHTDIALSRDGPSSATSPIKSPWRRFFNKTLISRSLESRDRSTNYDDHRSLTSVSSNHDVRPQSPSEESHTRDISPASLRRLLVEEPDTSTRPVTRGSLGPPSRPRTPTLDVLDQLDEEDDDNFVGAADGFSLYAAEEPLFTTRLSPPPFRRDRLLTMGRSSPAQTVVPSSLSRQSSLQSGECTLAGLMISPTPQHAPQLSILESLGLSVQDSSASSACPSSTLSSAMNSPASPTTAGFPSLCDIPTAGDLLSFYDESHEGDDDIDQHLPLPGHQDGPAAPGAAARISSHVKAPSTASFSRYHLPPLAFSTDKPPAADDADTLSPSPRFATLHSPLLLPRPGESGESSNLLGPNFLGSSLVGLDDFGHELSWIADSITGRRQS